MRNWARGRWQAVRHHSLAQIAARTWAEATEDNISIVAAGIGFMTLLAMFPTLTVMVTLYGLVADPAAVGFHVQALNGFLPDEGVVIIARQLADVTATRPPALGIGLLFSIVVALWSAAGGVKSMMTGLNIAYDLAETRGFMRFTTTALGLTAGLIVMVLLMLGAVIAVPALLEVVGLGTVLDWIVSLIRWPVLAAALLAALSLLYRCGPARHQPRWQFLSWGSILATGMWLLGSSAFSLYVRLFANYNKTYGSLAAGIILLLWMYLGAYAILLGAELNAVLEERRQKRLSSETPPLRVP